MTLQLHRKLFTVEEYHKLAEIGILKDRDLKKELYAQANISEYWIINLINRQVEIHRPPKNGEYHVKQIISEVGLINVTTIDFSIDYALIFPT